MTRSYQQFTGRYAIFFGVFAKTVGEVTEAITILPLKLASARGTATGG